MAAPISTNAESPYQVPPVAAKTRTQTHRRRLNREERKDILILRRLGYTYQAIAEHLHVSHRAVQYTCESNTCDPKKRPGRNSRLSSKQVDDIEAFLTASKENRSMSYKKIIEALGLDVKQDCLRRALQKRGYTRQVTSGPNCQSSKRSQLTGELCKAPDIKTESQNEPEPSAGMMLPEYPSPAGFDSAVALQHHRQPTAPQPQAPVTRYPHSPSPYQGHHSIAPQPQPVPLQHHPGPYHQAVPSEFRQAPQQYHSMAPYYHYHHHQQQQQHQQQHPQQCQSILLGSRSLPPQYNPAPLHPHSSATGAPQYHPVHEYHSISSNKLRPPPVPEYRRALSEYCPSLIDRRSTSVQTPSPFQSPSFGPLPIDPRHQNLSRSTSPGACQTTPNSHGQMLLEVSSMTDRSRKSSGYSTPLTIPDDRSDYYRYETSAPPEATGIDSETRLR